MSSDEIREIKLWKFSYNYLREEGMGPTNLESVKDRIYLHNWGGRVERIILAETLDGALLLLIPELPTDPERKKGDPVGARKFMEERSHRRYPFDNVEVEELPQLSDGVWCAENWDSQDVTEKADELVAALRN